MKQFLRYQISGSVFVLWFLTFYFGTNNWNLLPTIILLKDHILTGLAISMPIGVLIHQFSVLIKNWIIGKFAKEFSDFPDSKLISKLTIQNNDRVKYCIERISNLNSFYYVRFDNGILAPFLAILFSLFCGVDFKYKLFLYFMLMGFITFIYIFRIYKEIKEYIEIIKKL